MDSSVHALLFCVLSASDIVAQHIGAHQDGDAGIFLPRGHRIVSAEGGFVILDGGEQQKFRLLGVGPTVSSLTSHVAIGIVTLVAIACAWLIFAHLQGRTIKIAGDWLGVFPEPVARVLFYVQWEAKAYFQVALQDIMTFATTPIGIGRNVASRIAGLPPLSRTHDPYTSNGVASTSNGRSSRRRRKHGVSGTLVASASQGTGSSYPGLYNTGNSCFLNSTLQSLASVAGVTSFLEQIIIQGETWDVPTPVTDALYDVITQLNTASGHRSAFVPRQLTDALSSLPQTHVGSFFYAHQQQDAHELLVLVTGALDDELKAVRLERQLAIRSQNVGLCAAIAPSLPHNLQKKLLDNPFRALIAQRTACLDCGYVEAVRHYAADELSLNVPSRAGSAITIEACLANWSKIEVVDWICFHCSLQRTLSRLRAESSYLSSTGGGLDTDSKQATASASAKKKSGAKRRKAREIKAKEDVVMTILNFRYSEDEVEALGLLDTADLKLDRTFSRGATKQVMLARTPKVLMLHINRSSYSSSNFGASKNNAAVLFAEELDLSHIVTGGDLSTMGDRPISRGVTPMREEGQLFYGEDGVRTRGSNGHAAEQPDAKAANGSREYNNGFRAPQKTHYQLCGIVVHYGGHSSGHYVAFRRRRGVHGGREGNLDVDLDRVQQYSASQDKWYRISDDSVSQCSLRDVLYQNPFLLFYERVDVFDETAQSELLSLAAQNKQSGFQHAFTVENGRMPSSLSEVAKQAAMYSNIPANAGAKDDERTSMRGGLPHGFEHLSRSLRDRERALHNPRIFERWASAVPEALRDEQGEVMTAKVSAEANHANGFNGSNGSNGMERVDSTEPTASLNCSDPQDGM